MDVQRRILAALLLASAIAVAGHVPDARAQYPPPSRTVLTSPEVAIPMDISSRHPIFEVRVNGEGPFRFLVDTGVGAVALVDGSIAEKLELPVVGDISLEDYSGAAPQTTSLVQADSIALEGTLFEECLCVVFDLGAVRTDFFFEGIVGFRAFAGCWMTLDYPNARLVLGRAAPRLPDGMTVHTVSFEALDGVPVVQGTVAGVAVRFTVDTGATATSIPEPIAGLVPFVSEPVATAMVVKASGPHTTLSARVEGGLKIGSLSIKNPTIEIHSEIGYLGYDILRYFAVTFDQEGGKAVFARKESAPISSPPVYSAGFGALPAEGGRAVKYVLAGLPASKAGLSVGDLILTVNGKPAESFDSPAWRALFEKPGNLELTVKRGGNVQAMKVPVVIAVE